VGLGVGRWVGRAVRPGTRDSSGASVGAALGLADGAAVRPPSGPEVPGGGVTAMQPVRTRLRISSRVADHRAPEGRLRDPRLVAGSTNAPYTGWADVS
jgi:hypothetical protein